MGHQTCQADGNWSACSGAVAPDAADDCNTAGDDANCNGTPNDTCNCTTGMTRPCGKNDGNCQEGTQTCTANAWGSCVGEIAPQATDSCTTTGDDANCNGEVNERCQCVSDNSSACNDNVACTDNICTNGVCSNPVSTGFCHIGGQCYQHNQQEPGNPCRYCDATLNRAGWTNSPSTVTCNDNLWCNGNDTCSSGTCKHEFTGNRCTATGPCALSTCDEARDSCFQPSTFTCSSTTERQCSSTSACSADVQTRTLTRKCSGSSADCNATPQAGSWTTAVDCNASQTCSVSGTNFSCTDTVGCGSTWCDPSSNLCWMTTNPGKRSVPAAISYCDNLSLAGLSNWRLASIYDYLTMDTGCNGLNGTPRSGASTCGISDGGVYDCTACPKGSGPGNNGCYWPSSMGACDTSDSSFGGYWSSSSSVGPMLFDPAENEVLPYATITTEFQFRCVHDR